MAAETATLQMKDMKLQMAEMKLEQEEDKETEAVIHRLQEERSVRSKRTSKNQECLALAKLVD